jgi:phosphoribosylaminoimidazole (AIR) synthetase
MACPSPPLPAQLPPLFRWLQEAGNVPLDDMRRTFNMGVGMIMVVSPNQARRPLAVLTSFASYRLGKLLPRIQGWRHAPVLQQQPTQFTEPSLRVSGVAGL